MSSSSGGGISASIATRLNASRVAARTSVEAGRLDEPGAQREPHQDVVGRDLPALGIVDLEPPAAGADLREQLRLLRERVGVGLEPREAVEEAGEAAPRRIEQALGRAVVVAFQPASQVAPQGGAPVRVGDRLVVDGEQLGDRRRVDVPKLGGGSLSGGASARPPTSARCPRTAPSPSTAWARSYPALWSTAHRKIAASGLGTWRKSGGV